MIARALAPTSVTTIARNRGKFPFGLTQRTLILLLFGTVWLIPAFLARHFSWGLLAWDLTVLLLAIVDGIRLPTASQFHVTRTWLSAAALGNSTEVELSIVHDGSGALRCTVLDDLPTPFLETPQALELKVYANVAALTRYKFTARQRGDHSAAKVFLRYRSTIGMVERWAMADLAQSVRIYPAIHATEDQSLFLARTRQLEMQLRKQQQRGLGRDFESLRDYREGDDLRDVCWTAAARRGTLVSKQYQLEKSQPVWIMADTGRLLQARVGDYTKLDYATTTALAMAQLALVSGDRVGLLVYGREVQQLIAPARGGSHLRQIMESLALAQGEQGEADHLRAAVRLSRLQPRRSLILWLTDLAETAMRPEVVDGAAQLMRRHLVLFVAIRQMDLGEIAAMRPKNARQMFQAAAAQELVFRREVLLARLRERGALTLETTPTEMTSSVLNRYLEIKERALL
jgi:uncharacterized protein (DUF58 family)